ncbi:MAG: ferredoxin family protein [Planctomycetota bacterium]
MITAAKKPMLTLVVSKGQSRHPDKRGLESKIAELAGQIDDVDVIVVPHLYDLPKGGESLQALSAIEGDILVVSWIFPRAAHWVLDRNGIDGQVGEVHLHADEDGGDPDADAVNNVEAVPVDRMTDLYPRRSRTIYCVDLKTAGDADTVFGELQRLLGGDEPMSLPVVSLGGAPPDHGVQEVTETTGRRWYPVIDYDRCTNCMECIDFCLFGVYGVDGVESILVEQPDNCRKGCPACSRVCPENAIMFPQHKAPAIAGAPTDGDEGFKIDLSQLFGAPAGGDDPIATAARERDEHLMLAGRQTIGIDDQLRKRQVELQAQPKDSLDQLIDSLDELDL